MRQSSRLYEKAWRSVDLEAWPWGTGVCWGGGGGDAETYATGGGRTLRSPPPPPALRGSNTPSQFRRAVTRSDTKS